MKISKRYLAIEFLLLFVAMPVILAIDFGLKFEIYLKILMVLLGFGYLLVTLRRLGAIQFKIKEGIDWKAFWKRVGITFLLIAAVTIVYVFIVDKAALFYVPFHNPGLFVIILFVYTLFSVWPQEIIYRTFFYERYQSIFPKKAQIVFVNAIVFMMAHLFFRNTLVLVLTFIGGIIFGLTYLRFKSTTLVSIEHAIYGNWLFTVGMGEMLAFPGMESAG
ncbi:MAG: CPBP family intramembrane glutamic endopeptidase [Patiriisocius sp.]|uniref:CPBP family intramembrane glutamic endopeptidase n=1 Tax=Patiriisocius sp. TaxID=2822396 RepID=UPI003EF87D40